MSSFYPLYPFLFTLFLQIFIHPAAFADNYHDTNNPLPSLSLRPGSSSFKPSTAVFIFLAVLSVLFCVIFLLLLLYSKCCGTESDNNPFGFSHASALVSVGSAGRNSGLNQVVVESLPLFRFSSLRGQKDGLQCAVCLTRFEPNELLRLLPKCKHAYAECVDTWLDAHSTCPLCRYRVDPEDILLIQDQDLTTVSLLPPLIGSRAPSRSHRGRDESRGATRTPPENERAPERRRAVERTGCCW